MFGSRIPRHSLITATAATLVFSTLGLTFGAASPVFADNDPSVTATAAPETPAPDEPTATTPTETPTPEPPAETTKPPKDDPAPETPTDGPTAPETPKPPPPTGKPAGKQAAIAAAPTLTQQASAGGALGTSITDTATVSGSLSGNFTPVFFSLYGPGGACDGAPIFTTAQILVGDGSVTSLPFTPVLPGTYRWIVTFPGEQLVVTDCSDPAGNVTILTETPSMSTTASPGITLGAGTISDSMTLSGGISPTGSATFTAYGPNDATCTGTPVFTSTTIVVGAGPFTSAPFAPDAAGTYRWIASYSGDPFNSPVTGQCNDPGESVAVSAPLVPAISSHASAGGPVYTSISDSATLSGVTPDASGNLRFFLYGPDDANCSGPAVFGGLSSVSGGGTYDSTSFVTQFSGTYRYVASYDGDANNAPATTACNATDQSVDIVRTPVMMSTKAEGGELVGFGMRDSATITSSSLNQFAAIDFKLYGPDDDTCTGTPVFAETQYTLTGVTPSTSFYYPTQTGTYRWVASFAGDNARLPAIGTCGDPSETTVVNPPKHPTLTSQVNTSTATLGDSVSDTAILIGGDPLSFGDVTFNLYGPGDTTCTGTPVFTSSTNVSGGSATSASFIPTQAGTYRWVASFAGDFRSDAVAGACNDAGESVDVSLTTPTLNFSASSSVPLGLFIGTNGSLNGNDPTGSITFTTYGPDDSACTGEPIDTTTHLVLGNGFYSSNALAPSMPGTYRFVVSYSGDEHNQPVATSCGDPGESVMVIGKLTPSIETFVNGDFHLGLTSSDGATVTGGTHGPIPTGSVTFDLYGPNDAACTGASLFTSTVPLGSNGSSNSAGARSDGFTPTAPGTYRYIASYSGDNTYSGVTAGCNDEGETFVVTRPVTTISSQVSDASINLGQSFHDTATRTYPDGSEDPSGMVTFNVYGPDDATCTGTPAFTSSTTTRGQTTSDEFFPTAPGAYRVVVVYGGDNLYDGVTTACDDPNETVTVTDARIQTLLTTRVSDSTVFVGDEVSDIAQLGPAGAPGGTVTFDVYGPDDTTCAGTPVFTSTSYVDSTTVQSTAFTPTAPGTYRFIASYSGDASGYKPVAGSCGDDGETFTAVRPTASVSAQVTISSLDVGEAFDTLSFLDHTGTATPTGTETVRIYGPDDTTCAGTPVFVNTQVTDNSGQQYAGPFVPTTEGIYRAVVTFSGDAVFDTVTSPCMDEYNSVTVIKPVATLSTYVTNPEFTIGGAFQDLAEMTFNSVHEPTGTITFRVYGPDDATCTGTPVFVDTQGVEPVDGNTSDSFTPTSFGTYRVIATYSGDSRYTPVSGECNDPGESVVVSRYSTTISGQVSDSQIDVGDSFHDTVTLGGQPPVAARFAPSGAVSAAALLAPTGTITFTYYGPGDAACSTALATATVAAAATVDSAAYTPTSTGTYRVIASYGGDTNYSPAATDCGDPDQAVTVLAVTSTPNGSGDGDSDGTKDNPAAALPDTGASENFWLVALLGLGLAACGSVLVGANRRRV